MVHHDTHHFQTYLIFFLVSLISIGTLALLFMPPMDTKIQSSVLEKPISDSQSAAFLDDSSSGETTSPSSNNNSSVLEEGKVTKRMKFTKLLLRYQ